MILINIHNITVEEWPWRYRVPSSRPGVQAWCVDVRTNRCDCPAGRVKHPCKHKRWAMEYFLATWKLIAHRMTQTEAGWKLLREFEAFVKQEQ